MASRLNRSKTVQAARRAAKALNRHRSGAPPGPRGAGRRGAVRLTAESAIGPGARRVRWVTIGFGVATAILLGQAARLQLFEHRRLAAIAERQATSRATITAKRGAIRDRNGDELAITVDVDSVYFEWRGVYRRATSAEITRLAELLNRPVKDVTRKLNGTRRFTYLARRVDATTAEQVRGLQIPGVGTKREPKRFYANVHLAAHVLGFTNVDGEGRAGIERRYNERLKGRRQAITGLRDALGTPIMREGSVPQFELRGADIELTIDRQIQFAAEEALAAAVGEHRAKSGVALVMEPDTGDVLALASFPRFNPNNLRRTTVSERTNRAVNAVFEPGSTLKMVTVAGALEEGLIQSDTVLDCEDGSWTVGGNEIHDARHRFGNLTITEVIQKSSNICAAKIGFRLGRKRLHRWLKDFGFGQPTGIELPGELKGLIRAPRRWSDIGLANIAFGQGVSVTPVQVLQAAATLANGGVRVPPRLVRSFVAPGGRRTSVDRPDSKRVVAKATAEAVTRMMTTVTEPGGTAPAAAIPGFKVAGKSGTAQKVDPVTRAYSHELYVASFVGFVPADAPRLVALVLIDEPKGSIYGGAVAAPAWQKIALAALAAKGLRPDDPAAWQAFQAGRAALPTLPAPAGVAEAVNGEAAPSSDEALPTPAEDITAPLDLALSRKAQRLLGLVDPAAEPVGKAGAYRMPNFAHLTLREVLNRAADTRCDLVVDGTGRVVEQRPPAGMPLAPDARCELTLAPRR